LERRKGEKEAVFDALKHETSQVEDAIEMIEYVKNKIKLQKVVGVDDARAALVRSALKTDKEMII